MRLKLYLIILFTLVISLLSGACTKTACADEFENITWELKSYGPVDNMQPVAGTNAITIQFKSSNGQISDNMKIRHREHDGVLVLLLM